MAKRPVYFIASQENLLVDHKLVDFLWHPGMASVQKQKSIKELHQSALESGVCSNPLEISSKSEIELGVRLSAFNLTIKTISNDKEFTVETAFQSSKVFQNGGPYTELLFGTSRAAKKDPRLKTSGNLTHFKFKQTEWPLEPKTAFYDWLYINALKLSPWLIDELSEYDGFTDIEFNPKKSINCQAYSVTLFLALQKRGLLDDALKDKDTFLSLLSNFSSKNTYEDNTSQAKLL